LAALIGDTFRPRPSLYIPLCFEYILNSIYFYRLSADKSSAVLGDTWVSQANVNQRRGRAGRTRPGQSYHLFSREKYENLQAFPLPELHRIPLQKIVLDLKVGQIYRFTFYLLTIFLLHQKPNS